MMPICCAEFISANSFMQISGHKSRFAIRFMPLDSENGTCRNASILNWPVVKECRCLRHHRNCPTCGKPLSGAK
jgi:hypothetical protein